MSIYKGCSLEKKLDRRVQRTRAMLRTGLIAAILEKGYEAVTVQDIADKADLRRATFYLHYKDKEELLLAALSDTFEEVRQQLDAISDDALAGKTRVETFTAMFQHVEDNRDLYRIILTGQGTERIARYIRDYLANYTLKGLKKLPAHALALPPEVIAHYIAGAEVAFITWWLESNPPHTTDELAAMCQRLILDGVLKFMPA